MLSTIVLYQEAGSVPAKRGTDPTEALVRTLASLVRANVEGLLRDVAIAGPRGYGLDLVADHAGCGLIEAGSEPEWLRQAIAAARGPELLLLRSGHAPDLGFIEEAGDFVSGRWGPPGIRIARLHVAPAKLTERIFPRLAPLAGLIGPRDLCFDASGGTFETLARRVGKAAMLRSRARRVV